MSEVEDIAPAESGDSLWPFPIPMFHVEELWHITGDGHWLLRRSRSPPIQHFRTPRRQLGLSLPRRSPFLPKIPSLLRPILIEWHAELVANAGVVREEDLKASSRQVCAGVCSVTLDAIGAGLVDVGVAGKAASSAAVAGVGLVGELGVLVGTRRGYLKGCTAFVLGLDSWVVCCGCCLSVVC